MTLRKSVVPAALAFAGCLSSESEPPPALDELTYQTPIEDGFCRVEEVTYRVRAELVVEGAGEKSSSREGALLVSVAESSSMVECGEDIARIATPGAELARGAFEPDITSFAIDAPGAVVGGHRPAIWVRALLDANDNGQCDDGELVGTAELDAVDLDGFELELTREGCPGRS